LLSQFSDELVKREMIFGTHTSRRVQGGYRIR
jgi:hypothetical protein